MTNAGTGLDNPLEYVELIQNYIALLKSQGYGFSVSNDMAAFNACKQHCRGIQAAPMFHPDCGDLEGKAFWSRVFNDDDETIGLNAYRLDYVDTNLADWVTGWMAGLYMKAGILMVPEALAPSQRSRSRQLCGWLVYHGELWVADNQRGWGELNEVMTYAGHLVAMLKWNPDAMWALVNHRIAIRGTGLQNGYPYAERSFLRWKWHPDDIPDNEWLLYAERRDFERIVPERLAAGLMALKRRPRRD